MSGLNQLWLSPICHEDGDGRLWCEDDVWGDDCGCGIEQHSAVRYVLASDYDRDTQALRAEIERYIQEGIKIADQRDELRAQVEAMRAAIEQAAKGILWLQASVPMSLRASKRASKDYNAAKRAALQAKP